MKFGQYRTAEDAFQTRYGAWLKEHKYCTLLLESKLREEFDISQGRRSHEKQKKPLIQYLPTYWNLRHPIYRFLLSISSAFTATSKTSEPKVFFQWHQEKRNSITEKAREFGFSLNRGTAGALHSLHLSRARMQSLVGVHPRIWMIYKSIYRSLESSIDIENTIKHPKRIDSVVKGEVEKAARIFQRTGVKYLIIGSDQSAYNRLLCEAARLAGIKTAVIAHGYFSSPHLGGVLPVYADRLFVWTNLQLNEIHEVMDTPDREKVVCEGFPYPVNKAQNFGDEVLLALDDIPRNDPKTWWNTYDRLVAILLDAGNRIVIRPRRDSEIHLFKNRSPNSRARVSRADLYDDFDKVTKVVCGQSSLGVQAAFYGLPVARVKEWATDRYVGEGISRIPLERLAQTNSDEDFSARFLHADATSLTLTRIVNVLKDS